MATLFIGDIPQDTTADGIVGVLCVQAGIRVTDVAAVKLYTRPNNTSCAHMKAPTAIAAQKLLALQAVGFDVRLARDPTGRQQV